MKTQTYLNGVQAVLTIGEILIHLAKKENVVVIGDLILSNSWVKNFKKNELYKKALSMMVLEENYCYYEGTDGFIKVLLHYGARVNKKRLQAIVDSYIPKEEITLVAKPSKSTTLDDLANAKRNANEVNKPLVYDETKKELTYGESYSVYGNHPAKPVLPVINTFTPPSAEANQRHKELNKPSSMSFKDFKFGEKYAFTLHRILDLVPSTEDDREILTRTFEIISRDSIRYNRETECIFNYCEHMLVKTNDTKASNVLPLEMLDELSTYINSNKVKRGQDILCIFAKYIVMEMADKWNKIINFGDEMIYKTEYKAFKFEDIEQYTLIFKAYILNFDKLEYTQFGAKDGIHADFWKLNINDGIPFDIIWAFKH